MSKPLSWTMRDHKEIPEWAITAVENLESRLVSAQPDARGTPIGKLADLLAECHIIRSHPERQMRVHPDTLSDAHAALESIRALHSAAASAPQSDRDAVEVTDEALHAIREVLADARGWIDPDNPLRGRIEAAMELAEKIRALRSRPAQKQEGT